MNIRIVVIASITFLLGVVFGNSFQPDHYYAPESATARSSAHSETQHKVDQTIQAASTHSEDDDESLFLGSVGDGNEQIVADSELTINPSQLELEQLIVPPSTVNAQQLINELALVSNWQDLKLLDIEDMAESESDFLMAIEQSPELVKQLLSAYKELPEDGTRDLLRSMLTASGMLEVEQYAVSELVTSDIDSQSQWLYLLESTGVSSADSRNTLFSVMDGMADPQLLKSSLHAFTPDIVSQEEQIETANRLETYINLSDENVRSAGVEALSRWVDKDNSQFIETALNDESEIVRRSAIFSSYIAGIQSISIKNHLIQMLEDESQPYHLRLDAFNALSTYQLHGEDYQKFFQFNEEVEATHSDRGNAKG